MANSILRYYKPASSSDCRLPSPHGPLSRSIPSAAIASANREVQSILDQQSKPKKRGPYERYTPSERAKIGKFASECGVQAAVRKFSKDHRKISESTIRGFKNAYREELLKKWRARGDADDFTVTELQPNKQGRPLLLGKSLDDSIQQYVISLRENGGIINTAIVISGAKGLLKSMNRTMLVEYGGPATLSKGWAKSLLKRMNFTKRIGTTQAKITPEHFEELRLQFLQDIVNVVKMEDIPPSLVFNWDQTGLYLVPASKWTMAPKGQKRVRVKGLNDKRMITGVFCATLIGDFLPMQIIYGGKTNRCHPSIPFPDDWDIAHNEKHWSNEATMLQYIENVIVPFVTRVRDDLGCNKEQAALAIFDHFKGQLTDKVMQLLEKHNIQSVLVPPNCTDKLQPLDLTVNKVAKSYLQREFQEWYANEVSSNIDTNTGMLKQPVDLSTSKMKCIGVPWLVRLYEHIATNPQYVVNGFIAAGIPQSIDAGQPIALHEDNNTCTDDESTDDEYTDDECIDDEYTNSDDDNSGDDIYMYNDDCDINC